MTTATHPLPAGSTNTKPLWAAVSVLGVAVLALGASLVYVQTRPLDGHTALASLNQPVASAVADAPTVNTGLPVSSVAGDEAVLQARPAVRAAKPALARQTPPQPQVAARPPAPAPPRPLPAPAPAPVAQSAPPPIIATTPGAQAGVAPVVITESGPLASRPIYQTRRVVCADCGRVESVTPISRRAPGNGVGAVAGGVLGAVVGNQIGKGGGRTIATILGAVGGGVAGNAIENNMHTETVYRVQVRMDDGSIRSVEQAQLPALGSAVIVEGGSIRPADGSANYTPAPRAAPPPARIYSTDRT